MVFSNDPKSLAVTRLYRLAGIIAVLLLILACFSLLLPRAIVYLVPDAVYPNSHRTATSSGGELDATRTKLHLFSNSTFHTPISLGVVYDWYGHKGWNEVGRNQGIALERRTRIELLNNYALYLNESVGIIQLYDTQIEISMHMFLVPRSP